MGKVPEYSVDGGGLMSIKLALKMITDLQTEHLRLSLRIFIENQSAIQSSKNPKSRSYQSLIA